MFYLLDSFFDRWSLPQIKELFSIRFQWEPGAFEVAMLTFADNSTHLVVDVPTDVGYSDFILLIEHLKDQMYEEYNQLGHWSIEGK